MYTLNEDYINSLEHFIGKLPDSMIKSKIEKWLEEVKPTERITAEQLEQFVAFSTHLPKEVQNFPQSFAHTLKNLPATEVREVREDIAEPADLLHVTDESISHVKDQDAPENKEETLHNLGKKIGPKPKGKIVSKAAKTKGKK